MPRSKFSADDGTASLEFLSAGLVLLLPIVYLIMTLSDIQGAAFAVEGAARQAARVYVDAPSTSEADAAASAAIQVALADYGIDARDAVVAVSCRPEPSNCLTRRGFVTVSIRLTVPLPLMPPFLSIPQTVGVSLSSIATEQVSRFSVASQ